MGDAALADTLIQEFIANAPGDIEELKAAIASGDGALVRSAAHFIKVAAANLCAPGINAAAFAIEQVGLLGHIERASGLVPMLESNWLAFLKHPKVMQSLEIGN